MRPAAVFLSIAGALALTLGVAAAPAWACESHCDCPHKEQAAGSKDKAGAKPPTARAVSLEGTVVTYGCQMKAEKTECTGAALVVGEDKHLIKKAAKGDELVVKAKDTNKVVKVTGTKKGDFLTVKAYQIKS